MQDFVDELNEAFEVTEGEAAPEVEKPVEPEGKTEIETQESDGEDGDGSTEVESPPDESSKQTVPVAALIEKRRENQDLKRKIDELTAKGAQPQKEPEPETAVPDPVDDPVAYSAYMESRLNSAVETRLLNFSQSTAERAHGKEAVEVALEAIKAATATPGGQVAYREIMASPDPFESLIQWHKDASVLQEIGADPVAYREKVRSELRAELEAELAAKQAEDVAAKPAPSIATATGSGGPPKGAEAIDDSLDAILEG